MGTNAKPVPDGLQESITGPQIAASVPCPTYFPYPPLGTHARNQKVPAQTMVDNLHSSDRVRDIGLFEFRHHFGRERELGRAESIVELPWL